MNGGFIFYSRCKAELTFTLFACVSPFTRARVVFSLFCTRSSIVAGVGFARVLFWKKKVTLWLESVSFVTWAVPPNMVIVYVACTSASFAMQFHLVFEQEDLALKLLSWTEFGAVDDLTWNVFFNDSKEYFEGLQEHWNPSSSLW